MIGEADEIKLSARAKKRLASMSYVLLVPSGSKPYLMVTTDSLLYLQLFSQVDDDTRISQDRLVAYLSPNDTQKFIERYHELMEAAVPIYVRHVEDEDVITYDTDIYNNIFVNTDSELVNKLMKGL